MQTRTVEEKFLIMILGRAIPFHVVKKSEASESLLEIDIEQAWKEMGLDSGWSNEVTVEVIVS